jgi:WD40 repeat protein
MTELPVFATGGNDKDVHIWTEVDQGYVDQLLRGHTDSVTAIVFEGFFLITGSEDLTIRIWDTVNMVQLSIITRLHMSAIRAVVHLPVEAKFASCDSGDLVMVYDYVKRKELWKVKHTADCKCIYVDQERRTLYACVRSELIPHELNETVLENKSPEAEAPGPFDPKLNFLNYYIRF